MPLRSLLLATVLSFSGTGLAQSDPQTDPPTDRQTEAITELVRMSDVVVVVVPAKPTTVTIPLEITPFRQMPDAQKWPPWLWVRERFIVQEVISNRPRNGAKPKKLKVGAVIEVDSATHGTDEWVHRQRYLDGVGVSMIGQRYDAVGSTTSPARILFLQKHPGGLQHAMTGGTEHVEHRALVDAAVLATAPAPK